MEKTLKVQYVIRHAESDLTKHLSYTAAGDLMLDAAGLHAVILGTGMEKLMNEGHTWVVTGMLMKFFRRPVINSHITLETGVSKITRITTERFYHLSDSEGEFAQGSTEWMIINVNNRRPVFIADAIPDINDYVIEELAVEPYKKLRFAPDSGIKKSEMTPHYSDLDINGHLYSMKYLSHVLDLFDIDTFKNNSISKINMNYIAEVLPRTKTEIFEINRSQDVCEIEMRNNDGKPVFKAEITFNI